MNKKFPYGTKKSLDALSSKTFGMPISGKFEDLGYCLRYEIKIPEGRDIGVFLLDSFQTATGATLTSLDTSTRSLEFEIEPQKI